MLSLIECVTIWHIASFLFIFFVLLVAVDILKGLAMAFYEDFREIWMKLRGEK